MQEDPPSDWKFPHEGPTTVQRGVVLFGQCKCKMQAEVNGGEEDGLRMNGWKIIPNVRRPFGRDTFAMTFSRADRWH